MNHIYHYSLFLVVLLFATNAAAQQVTRTWTSTPNSTSIDGGANYGTPLPSVSFTQADFNGCEIADVDVRINWAKTDGTCSAPTGGNSFHAETSFRIDGPTGNEILAVPGTWTGNATTTNVITTFSQQAGTIPSGTPVSGTFRPNNGNLNNYNGDEPFGAWNLSAGDNAPGDPLCIVSYAVQVTVTPDVTPPTWTSTPSSFGLATDPGQCSAVATWSAPTATDNCSVTITQTAGPTSGSTLPIGPTTISYQAVDTEGNINTHSFIITVFDDENPSLSCPTDLQVNAPFGSCAANVSFTTPTASDNCPGTTVAQLSGAPTSGQSFPLGNTTVSFRATDGAGNTADCSFNVQVLDIEDPTIACPANINVVSTTGNCGAVVNYTTPTANDNCPGAIAVLNNGFPSGATFPSGTTTVEYLAIDASGNQNDCSFEVTVDPVPNGTMSIPPVSVCQGNQTTITFNFTSGTGPYNVVITDGVSNFTVNGVNDGDTYQVTPPTTVTYSYVSIQDATGCVRTSDFDGTASVVVTPIPIVNFSGLDAVYCESEASVTLTGNQAGGTFTGAGITDLGGGSATFSPSAAGPTGPYTITYEYTDLNGCTDSETQQVSVDEQPVANAGSGGSECDLDFSFSAIPSVGVGTWTTVSGPGLPLFSNINSPTSIVQVSTPGTYVFQWEEVNGECSDSEQITVVFNEVPVANPGFGGAECDFNFPLGANPSVGIGTWTAVGPGTASYAPNENDANAVVTVDTYGTYTFTWTEDNNGCVDDASITVTFEELPVANAGTGGDECDLTFVTNGSATVGVGTWTASGPGAVTFNAPNSAVTDVTVSNYGTYTFTWTEVNGNCSSTDQITVNFYEQPVADAGAASNECDLDYSFSGSLSSGTGVWTYAGPGIATFADDTDPTSDVTVDTYGQYNFTWTETNGTCSDSESILVSFDPQPVANAGVGGNECDLNFTFNAVASAGVGLWTASGPGNAVFDNDLDPTTTVTVDTYGTYEFTWTEISGTCIDAASVTVNFFEQPVVIAGPGGDECDLDFLLQAFPSVGTGEWTQTLGPGNATFSNTSSPTSLVTVDAYGTYEFTWTETNGTCVDFRSTTVNFFDQPVADAGSGGDECDLDFDLNAVASVGTGLWTASGPGTATFTDDTDPSATVTVSQSGAYTFTWTETNGVCVSSDDVTVNFYDQPVANAGTGGDECDLNFVFNGTASFGTGAWTYTGAGSAFFGNPNDVNTTVTVDTYGSYEFTWTEVNGVCSDDATITVNFYQQPVADAGQGGSECDLDFDLNATPSIGNGVWTYSGPGNATFAPADTDPNATVTVDATGSYTFTWTEDNNGCTDSEDITVVFNPLPVVSFTGLAATYCVDQSTPVPLTGSPAGGTFTGLGISGNSFVPSVAGVGTIFITYIYTDSNGCTNSETQSVDVNGLPNVTFSGLDAAYCEDDANPYTLVGSPSGGTFSGLGISGDDFIPSDAGSGTWTINYTYTDPFGCTSFDDQTVVINELPVVSFTGLSPEYCEDASSANLVGSPAGGTFTGTGIIGAQFSPVAAGVGIHTVTYTYTDGNGCTNSETQTVTVNAVPLPMITPSGVSEICDGDDLVLDAGAGYSVYSWSNNTNGQTTTVNQAGTYNVIVITADGCAGTSAPVQVVVNDLPTVDLGNDTTICTASVLTLDAGNAGSSYAWSTFEVNQTINVTTTGVYIVDVTDANGCTGTDAISVTVADLLDPVIVSSGPLTFCDGDSVTLDAGPDYDSYLWNNGETTQTITTSTSGIVTVQVWDQFGCEGSDDESIAVLQNPNVDIAPSGVIEICDGDTATLSAGSPYASYSWYPGGETTEEIEITQSGFYTVTVEDENNGCFTTADSVQLIVNTTVSPSIVPSGATEFCEGESVSLSVVPGPYNSILWSSGSTTPSIVVTESGNYSVTVIDANGCLDSTLTGNSVDVTVWNPTPIADQLMDSVVVLNTPFSSYQWFYNGSAIPGATNYFHLPNSNGIYYCEVTDENGCVAESNFIEFNFTGITDVEKLYDVSVYPNPTESNVTVDITFNRSLDASIEVTDITGRQIIAPIMFNDVSERVQTFDFSALSSGLYYVQIKTIDGVISKPILKQQKGLKN